MQTLRFFFTFAIGLIFIWLVFLLSWYVALPLLIIWALFGSARWIYAKFLNWRYQKDSNGCQIHPAPSETKHTTIIDADYTEL